MLSNCCHSQVTVSQFRAGRQLRCGTPSTSAEQSSCCDAVEHNQIRYSIADALIGREIDILHQENDILLY
jgi:hypothetical protein